MLTGNPQWLLSERVSQSLLEAGFIAHLLPPWFANLGKRLVRAPKVDFVVPAGGKRITLIEAKASRTVHPAQAAPLLRLVAAMKGYQTRSLLIHRSGREKPATGTLSGGASAVPANELAGALGPRQDPQ